MYIQLSPSISEQERGAESARMWLEMFIRNPSYQDSSDRERPDLDLYNLAYAFFNIRSYLQSSAISDGARRDLIALVEEAEMLFEQRFPDLAEPFMVSQAFRGLREIIRSRHDGRTGLRSALATSHWLQNLLHNAHLEARWFKRGWKPIARGDALPDASPDRARPNLKLVVDVSDD